VGFGKAGGDRGWEVCELVEGKVSWDLCRLKVGELGTQDM